MKKIVIVVSFLVFLLSFAFADFKSITQEDTKKAVSGSPTQAEYPNASAYLLINFDSEELNEDGTSTNTVYSRYKIFNERGYNYGTQSIGFREGYSEVKVLFANTVKVDGTVVPLDPKDINDFAPYAKFDMYSDVKEKKFTMPALEPGCIIEFAYEEKQIKPILPGDEWGVFYLQEPGFPTGSDIGELIVPKSIKPKYKAYNCANEPKVEDLGNRMKYTITNSNQPEIIPEPRMPKLVDRETYPLIFSWTLDSWETVSKWYNKLVREQMKTSPEMESFTKDLIKDKNTDEEKMKALYYYVAQKIRYVAVELGPNTHQPHASSDVFMKKYGDCKDKATLLLTMLKIAGIEGIPVLVPEDELIFDENMPTIDAFNHVIAAVPKKDGGYYWMDATNEVGEFGCSPFGKSVHVLAINNDGSYKIIKTPEVIDSIDYVDIHTIYNVQEDGDVVIEKDNYYYGIAAQGQRYMFKYMSPEERKKYFEKSGIVLTDLEFGDLTDNDKPFFIKLKGSMPSHLQKIGQGTLILGNDIQRESFSDVSTAKERKYPIAFTWQYLVKTNTDYVFPAGYKIKNLPESYTVDTPYAKAFSNFTFKDETFNWHYEGRKFEYKIPATSFEDFKKTSLQIQKYNADVRSILFEKPEEEKK